MELDEAPLVEIASARCVECGEEIAAAEFSDGKSTAWPLIVEGSVISRITDHKVCGGKLELGEVRPAWHFCDENCECGLGGLPERVE